MMEIQLSVRSALAWELAHQIALRENRTIRDVVERALDAYEVRHEPAAALYARLGEQSCVESNTEARINENRQRYDGLDV